MKIKKKPDTVRITFEFPKEVADALHQEAVKNSRTRKAHGERILNAHIEKYMRRAENAS